MSQKLLDNSIGQGGRLWTNIIDSAKKRTVELIETSLKDRENEHNTRISINNNGESVFILGEHRSITLNWKRFPVVTGKFPNSSISPKYSVTSCYLYPNLNLSMINFHFSPQTQNFSPRLQRNYDGLSGPTYTLGGSEVKYSLPPPTVLKVGAIWCFKQTRP